MASVCKNVGFDGQSFYCMRCGKAGFSSEMQARGHLSTCKGRLVSKGISIPFTTSGALPLPPPPAYGGGGGAIVPAYGGGGGGGGSTTTSPDWAVRVDMELASLRDGYNHLNNEYNHMLMVQNPPAAGSSFGDWISQNKGIVIFVGIIIFALYALQGSRNSCLSGDSPSGGSRDKIKALGEKAASKLVDRGVTKAVDSLFK